ncbi:hypothetical protein Lal_00038708 [Lupinus albus]|nr:hypothetical protein Lal_00038708 [Lupinus albus]
MHVTRSSNMVNPLIIECCKQKETITSGSEIGADNSSFGMVADPMSESTDVEFYLIFSLLPYNSSSPSLSIPPELFTHQLWPTMQQS